MLPKEIWLLIISFINVPTSFYNLAQTSKVFSQLCKELEPLKRKQFLKTIITNDSKFTVLPNWKKEGIKCTEIFNKIDVTTYKNGLRCGFHAIYNRTTHIPYEVSYFKDDKIHGDSYIFDSHTGDLLVKTKYIKGKQDGIRYEWNKRTKMLIKLVPFKQGLADGVVLKWSAVGVRKSRETYQNNLKHGESIYWSRFSGRLINKIWYEEGLRTYEETFVPKYKQIFYKEGYSYMTINSKGKRKLINSKENTKAKFIIDFSKNTLPGLIKKTKNEFPSEA